MQVHYPENLPKGLNFGLLTSVFDSLEDRESYLIKQLEELSEARQSKVYKVSGKLSQGQQQASFIIKIGSKEQIDAIANKENLLDEDLASLLTAKKTFPTNDSPAKTEAIALYTDAGYRRLTSTYTLKSFLENPATTHSALQNTIKTIIRILRMIHGSSRKINNEEEYIRGMAFLLSQLKTDLVLSEAEFLDTCSSNELLSSYDLSKAANTVDTNPSNPSNVLNMTVCLNAFSCSLADKSQYKMKLIENNRFLTVTAEFAEPIDRFEVTNSLSSIRGKITNTRIKFYLNKLYEEIGEGEGSIQSENYTPYITLHNFSYPNPFLEINKFIPRNSEVWKSEPLTISDNGIIHGDCNICNFLLDKATGTQIDLIDFERASASRENEGFQKTEQCAPIAWDYLVFFQSIKLAVLQNLLAQLPLERLITPIHEFEWILWTYIIFPKMEKQKLIEHFKNIVDEELKLFEYLPPLFSILDALISELKKANKENAKYSYLKEVSKIYYLICLRFAKHGEVRGVKFFSCVIGASFALEVSFLRILQGPFSQIESVSFVLDRILEEHTEFLKSDNIANFWKLYGQYIAYCRKEYSSTDSSIKDRILQLFNQVWRQNDAISYRGSLHEEALRAYEKGIGLFIPLHAYDLELFAKDKTNQIFDVFELIQVHKNLLILGDRGSGKSTIAYELIFRLIGRKEDMDPLKIGNFTPITLILFLNRDGIRSPLLTIKKFKDYIKMRLEPYNILNWDEYLRLGLFLFVIDGLNEIPDSDYNPIIQTIATLENEYPLNRYIVTSRRYGYKGGLDGFTQVTLCPFDNDAIKEYFCKNEEIDYFEPFMQDFQEILNKDEAFRTPFIALKLINHFLRYKADPTRWTPPQDIRSVYRFLVNQIFDDVIKVMTKGKGFSKTQKESIKYTFFLSFSSIAFEMTERQSLEARESELKDKIVEKWSEIADKIGSIDDWKIPIDDNGSDSEDVHSRILHLFCTNDLLVRDIRNDDTPIFRFCHHSYLEYLTSSVIWDEIKLSDNHNSVLEKYLRQRHWDETIQMMLSYMLSRQGVSEIPDISPKDILSHICLFDINFLVESLNQIELLPKEIPGIVYELLRNIIVNDTQPLIRRKQAVNGFAELHHENVTEEFETSIYELAKHTSKDELLDLTLKNMESLDEMRCQRIVTEIIRNKDDSFHINARLIGISHLKYEILQDQERKNLKGFIFLGSTDIKIRTKFIETFIWVKERFSNLSARIDEKKDSKENLLEIRNILSFIQKRLNESDTRILEGFLQARLSDLTELAEDECIENIKKALDKLKEKEVVQLIEKYQRIIDTHEIEFLVSYLSIVNPSQEIITYQIAILNLLSDYEVKLGEDILKNLLKSPSPELIKAALPYFDKLFVYYRNTAMIIWEQVTPSLERHINESEELTALILKLHGRVRYELDT